MKKRRTPRKKLSLSRQTVRTLTQGHLKRVGGANTKEPVDTNPCTGVTQSCLTNC